METFCCEGVVDEKVILNSELLYLFNQRTGTAELVERVVELLRSYLGCDAVGFRLMDEQGNFPYISYSGFPDDFVTKEGPLCITRDKCACVYIGTGEYDASHILYTKYGSFMSGNLQDLELIKEGMVTGKFRGECQKRGWETLALVPVRYAHNYMGLIQAVDRRRDAVSNDDLGFMENIAGQIALYLHTQNANARKENELNYLIRRVMHDLRTPLTNSMLMTELMQEERAGTPDEELSEYTGRMYSNSEYMMRLVSSLDSFANNESGVGAPEEIDLGEFTRGVLADMGIRDGSGVAVTLPDDMPVVSYNWLGLRRLLNNLISNAVKFSSSNPSPAIHIGCEEKDTFYIISVSDNGAGMDEEHLEKVFMPLYRTPYAKDTPGTGLGLCIARRIAESNGGRIWVYSKKGEGSTFYFTIPK